MAVHSKSSQKWLQEHHRDQYVKRAQTDGYRSRASYKLIEINQKDKIFKLEQELNKKTQLQERFNREIDELSQETEELVEEIDKWQM